MVLKDIGIDLILFFLIYSFFLPLPSSSLLSYTYYFSLLPFFTPFSFSLTYFVFSLLAVFLLSYLFFLFFPYYTAGYLLCPAQNTRDFFPGAPLYGMATHQAPRGSCALSWPPSLPHAGLRECGEACEKLGKTAIIILILTVVPKNGLRGWLVRAFWEVSRYTYHPGKAARARWLVVRYPRLTSMAPDFALCVLCEV